MSNLPVVPVVPQDSSPSLKKFLSSIKEIVEVREGNRGQRSDRFVTFDDIQNYRFDQTGSGNIVTTDDLPENDTTVPDPPTNLTVTKGIFVNNLSWDLPESDTISHTEVWCSTDSSISNAIRVAIVTYPQSTYRHGFLEVTDDHYYWIRTISYGQQYSTWEPSLVMGGLLVPGDESVGETIDGVMDILKGTTPDDYNAGTTYSSGDLVKYLCNDGATRRYRYINVTPGSGNAPEILSGSDYVTNLTYWERIGIIVQGDVDGTPTAGVDGNLVVDGTILARHIQVETLSAIQADIGEITAGTLESSNYTAGSQGVMMDLNNSIIKVYGTGYILCAASGGIIVNSGGGITINNGGGIDINYGGDITFAARTYAQGNPGFVKWGVGTDGTFQMGGYSTNNALTLSIPGATAGSPKGEFLIGREANLSSSPLKYFQAQANSISLWSPDYSASQHTNVGLSSSTVSLRSDNGTAFSLIQVQPNLVLFYNDSGASTTLRPAATGEAHLGNATYKFGNLYCGPVNCSTLTLSGQVTGDLIPHSSNTYNIGLSGTYWNNLYANDVYYKNLSSFDVMDDLEVIADLGTKSRPSSHTSSLSPLEPEIGKFPEFLTNKAELRDQIQRDSGDLITEEEINAALEDPDDMEYRVFLRAATHAALLEGGIRQQYALFKSLEARVSKLEGGTNGRIPSS